MSKYDGINASSLATMVSMAESNLAAMILDNADNKYDAALTREQNTIAELKAALVKAVLAGNNKAAGQTKDYDAYQTKNTISDQLRSIPKFRGTGPRELNQFLEKLDQCYDLCVLHGKHEEHFVRCAKLALAEDIYASLCSTNQVVETFASFKKWLCEAYDSQLTSFQLLGSAFGAEYLSSEKFIVFAQKIEKEVRTARNVIKAEHKRKNKGEDMSADQVFDLMGAMLMVEKLQAHHKSIYDAMVDKMNDLKTASDVATKAECLRDRCKGESIAPTEQAFYGGNKPFNKPSGRAQPDPVLAELQRSIEQQQLFNRQVMDFMKSNQAPNQNNKADGDTKHVKSPYNKHRKPYRKPDERKVGGQSFAAATQQDTGAQPAEHTTLGDIMGDQGFQQ